VAELARGRVTDRPWGKTLATLALRGLTGQLNLHADGRVYSVAFNQGVVVGAASPLANDNAVRIAMTGGLVSSTQVNELSRRLASAGGRDEIDVIAELTRIPPDQAQRLRRRVIAQRAARTFSIENGEFVVEDRITVPVVPGSELDIRSVVYLGARSNLSDQRLEAELARMGTFFKLKAEAQDDLPYFGFGQPELAVVERLKRGAFFSDLNAAVPEVDGHLQRAIVYSLIACAACDAQMAPAPPSPDGLDAPTITRARTGDRPAVTRTPTSDRPMPPMRDVTPRAKTASAAPPPEGAPVRMKTPTQPPPESGGVRMRTPTGAPPMPSLATAQPQRVASKPATARAKRNTAETRETEALIKQKLVDARGDHFQILGVPMTATADQIRTAYFNLARKLHPDRLSSLGITDDNRDAQRLFAQINTAFAVLNDPKQREEYQSVMARGGEAAVRAQDAQAEELAGRVMRAEEAFKQGEMALRRGALEQAVQAFGEAAELQPKEAEYQALFAWAKFAAAPDKNALANDTRKTLQRAADADDRSPTARFYLGRVERMLGREREALQHFQAVLMIRPNHAEAASEARVLEQRLKKR
jgi:Flp pilus assembly protein TadD